MGMNYQFVRRRDMRENAPKDQLLYYAQTYCSNRVRFASFVRMVAGHCSMSRGDVMNVLDGAIFFLTELLLNGSIVEMGDLGNFRITAGSSGVTDIKDFDTSLFNRPKITFMPGVMLTSIYRDVKYERGTPPGKDNSQSGSGEGGGEEGGGDDVLS